MKEMRIEQITVHPDMQMRDGVNESRVDHLRELYSEGVEVDPVRIVYNGQYFFLVDGFHRMAAAEMAGLSTIMAEVENGTKQDAEWLACAANKEHDRAGLYRSNAAKRRAVETALKLHPEMSDRVIAEHCGVNNATVSRRRQVLQSNTSNPPPPRIGKDGKSYRQVLTVNTSTPPPPPPANPPPVPGSSEDRNPPPSPPPNAGNPPPTPKRDLDREGQPIPEGRAFETWRNVRPTIQQHLTAISGIRSDIKRLEESDPAKLAGCHSQSVLIDLNNAYRKLSMAMPHAVCCYCGGDGCKVCDMRGMLDKVKNDTAPQDMKRQLKRMLTGGDAV